MATVLKIKSSVNGLEQDVSPKEYDVLKANGWKGRVIKTTETSKAKAPEEVEKKK